MCSALFSSVFGVALIGMTMLGGMLSAKTGLLCFVFGSATLWCLLFILERKSVVRTKPKGPLEGVRVLDLSVVIAGPLACAHLAEMGAQVIKIESLDNPDSARGLGQSIALGMASLWSHTGFGKQSIVLDLKKDEGLAVFRRLLKEVDVVVQNFRPGVVDRIGVGYEACKNVNPNIIYVSSYGYGNKGPLSQDPVYDPIIQCLVGIIYCQGDRQAPMLIGQALFDKFSCLSICHAIVSALLAREKGSGGVHIETSMIDTAMHWGWSTLFRDSVWLNPPRDQMTNVPPSRPSSLMSTLYGEATETVLTPSQIIQSEAFTSQLAPHTQHLLFGKQRHLKYPTLFSKHDLATLPCAPMMGEHTNKILNELNVNTKSAIKGGGVSSTASLLASRRNNRAAKVFKLLEFFQRCRRPGTGTFDGNRLPGASLSAPISDTASPIIVNNAPTAESSTPSSIQSVVAPTSSFANGPLSGMRVVELASLFAGPTASSLLSDHGANVIKVERTGKLDPLRHVGPFSASDDTNMGASFVALNRNKQSLTLDSCFASDCASLLALLSTADVLIVDNEEMQSWKHVLDTAALEHLVFCEIDKGKGELSVQATAGICYVQQGKTVCVPLAEKITGYYAAIAVTTALFSRQLHGKGQKVIVPMLSSTLHFSQVDVLYGKHYYSLDRAPAVIEYWEMMRLISYNDGGWGFLAPLNDKQWAGFVESFPEVMEEPEFEQYIVPGHWKNLSERFKVFNTIMDVVIRVASKCSSSQVEQRARTSGIPHQKVLSVDEVLVHPQIVSNNPSRMLQHSTVGPYRVMSSPIRFSISSPLSNWNAAPLPNEHGESILRSLRSK